MTFERLSGESASSTARGALQESYGGREELEDAPAAGRRLGALVATAAGPSVVDLNRALALKLGLDDAGAPEAEADSLLPPDPLDFLRGFEASLPAARRALAFALEFERRFDGPDLQALGVMESRRRVRLHAPVPRPGKIVGVARNYAAHAREQRAETPEEPVLFLKAASAVIGSEDPILLPAASRQVDFEGELAVVIGQAVREITAAEALGAVAGYCVANDVSARDFQDARGQRFIGKSCDGFAPLGPALVTADEVGDPQDLGLRTRLCGELMQDARTKEMRFPVAELISFASRLMTLEPGDVLLTGTPAGVGKARRPPRFLRDGDVVEVQIEKLGTLRNYVRGPRSESGT
ncbi:MAG: fumarylacetoacetate hydrolase family protein [Myxococcota bacterium]|nr:fumarylacetoacetate hydrolase family protein [Myxococcota bacterium]